MKFSLDVDPATAIAGIVAVMALAGAWFWWWQRRNFNVTEIELNIPFKIGKMTIKPTYEQTRIAYKAWVELATRKAALPFDPDHDVIAEVYNSWYALFGIMRELTKDIPPEEFCSDGKAQNLVRILVDALNDGLRPHLTKWQARYRHWYEHQVDDDVLKKLSPQEIQKKFPQYDALVADLKAVNQDLIEYANEIAKIASVRQVSK